MSLGMGISVFDTKKVAYDAAADKKGNCLMIDASGVDEESYEGASAVNVESNMDADAAVATEDGSF